MIPDKQCVSIGMAIYNEDKFLESTLVSLINQTYSNIEIIISDNASTDNTCEICKKYMRIDRRIRYYRQTKTTTSIENFNFVFSQATGEFFTWASGHDIRALTYVERCVNALNHDSSVILCYSRGWFIDSEGKRIRPLPGNIDTRGIPPVRRVKLFLRPPYAHQIYGLIRSDSLNQTKLNRPVFGPDVVILVELSSMGSFQQLEDELFDMRSLSEFPDWNRYWLNCYHCPISIPSFVKRYFQMLWLLVILPNCYLPEFQKKVQNFFNVFLMFCTIGSYQFLKILIFILRHNRKNT